MSEEQKLAQATLDLYHWYDPAHEFTQSAAGCTQEHIVKILEQVVYGEVTGGKANRFIGWAQGVLCMEGYLTLDDARNINRKVIEQIALDKNKNVHYTWGSMMGTYSVPCIVKEVEGDRSFIVFTDIILNEAVERWVDNSDLDYDYTEEE